MDSTYVVGIDVGGQTSKLGVVDARGTVLAQTVIRTDTYNEIEPYIAELTRDREDFSGPVVVPEDHIFAMGDNRNASTDSRDQRVGFIREEYILGKALFRMLPFGQFKIG